MHFWRENFYTADLCHLSPGPSQNPPLSKPYLQYTVWVTIQQLAPRMCVRGGFVGKDLNRLKWLPFRADVHFTGLHS